MAGYEGFFMVIACDRDVFTQVEKLGCGIAWPKDDDWLESDHKRYGLYCLRSGELGLSEERINSLLKKLSAATLGRGLVLYRFMHTVGDHGISGMYTQRGERVRDPGWGFDPLGHASEYLKDDPPEAYAAFLERKREEERRKEEAENARAEEMTREYGELLRGLVTDNAAPEPKDTVFYDPGSMPGDDRAINLYILKGASKSGSVEKANCFVLAPADVLGRVRRSYLGKTMTVLRRHMDAINEAMERIGAGQELRLIPYDVLESEARRLADDTEEIRSARFSPARFRAPYSDTMVDDRVMNRAMDGKMRTVSVDEKKKTAFFPCGDPDGADYQTSLAQCTCPAFLKNRTQAKQRGMKYPQPCKHMLYLAWRFGYIDEDGMILSER